MLALTSIRGLSLVQKVEIIDNHRRRASVERISAKKLNHCCSFAAKSQS